jgi:FAD/FMN-containing dehydrogenase
VLNIAGSWENAADDASNVAWARECFEATRACSTGGTYVNFLTEEEGRDRIEAAYSAVDLQRLAALKRQYDPDNLFRHTKRVVG